MDNSRHLLAYNLRRLRQDRERSQQWIASQIHLSQPVISQWEQGKRIPDAVELKRLADVFGVSTDRFFQPKRVD